MNITGLRLANERRSSWESALCGGAVRIKCGEEPIKTLCQYSQFESLTVQVRIKCGEEPIKT